MAEILWINACVRPESRTQELTKVLLEGLTGKVEEVRLDAASLACLDLAGLQARDQAARTQDYSDDRFTLAKQFAQAETVVISAPYWDLMFPAALKLYLETITVSGLTFRYTPQGRPEGLCRCKALYYVTTAGGYIGEGDFGFSYIKAMARGFFGIPRIYRLSAEGLDILGNDPREILEKAKAEAPGRLYE